MSSARSKVVDPPRCPLGAGSGWRSQGHLPVPRGAKRYVDRLVAHIGGFDLASERGSRRDDIAPGLRVVGFERRVTIAFTVEEEEVVIQRIFYGGQDWTSVSGSE